MQFLTIVAAVFATSALAAPFDGNDAEDVAADVAADNLRGHEANSWNRPASYDNNGYNNDPRWNNRPGRYSNNDNNNNNNGGWKHKRDTEAGNNDDWNRWNWNNNDDDDWNSGNGGNNEGPYQDLCTCTKDGRQSQWLGHAACNNLQSQYSNLYWNGQGCVDANNQGVEYNGFKRACQGVGGAGADAGHNVDAECY